MISVDERESIRRAYFLEDRSIRQIARELHHSPRTIHKAIDSAAPEARIRHARECPVLGPYESRIQELLMENTRLPRKQQYTGRRIYHQIRSEGYGGAESSVRRYIGQLRGEQKRHDVYIPLEFDAGIDAQVDWGEGIVIMRGVPVTAELFMMRLCYSRRLFVMAFPFQKQEAFFLGHVRAFHHFGGVPHCLSYDNLTTAVQRILKGRNRVEQEAFIVFRSHHLFESHLCTPYQPHEKGGIESDVGFARRNYLVPPPEVASFQELNELLLQKCLEDDSRTVDGQDKTIGEAWEQEKTHLLPLPRYDYECCVTRSVRVNPYSQVQFETNRYSVPVEKAYINLVLKAYPFQVKILHQDQVLATHPRCMGSHEEVIDPLHYLPLLEQRPGAFQHAKPMRRWREQWPPTYDRLLSHLRSQSDGMGGIREFIKILKLHHDHPVQQVEQAVQMALEYGCAHLEGVQLCLHQLCHPEKAMPPLDLCGHPRLADVAEVGHQPVDLHCYDSLLEQPALVGG
jgi:transposase